MDLEAVDSCKRNVLAPSVRVDGSYSRTLTLSWQVPQ